MLHNAALRFYYDARRMSYVYTYIPSFFRIFFPYRSSQGTEQGPWTTQQILINYVFYA